MNFQPTNMIFISNESSISMLTYALGFVWIRQLAQKLQPLKSWANFWKKVDFSKILYIKNWNFRDWNSKIEIALVPSKMSFVTICKVVFCVESGSGFEKNIIFYEKIIFANFIIDFASKFAILGLKSATTKKKQWFYDFFGGKYSKNDFFIAMYFWKR